MSNRFSPKIINEEPVELYINVPKARTEDLCFDMHSTSHRSIVIRRCNATFEFFDSIKTSKS